VPLIGAGFTPDFPFLILLCILCAVDPFPFMGHSDGAWAWSGLVGWGLVLARAGRSTHVDPHA
jgi:hypothetical protein